MENSARIRISVDDSALRDLRRSANELYRTISEQAQQQERGTIATSRNIQEQIELLRRRNQMWSQQAQASNYDALDRGEVSQRAFDARREQIREQYRLGMRRVNALNALYDREYGSINRLSVDAQSIARELQSEYGNDWDSQITAHTRGRLAANKFQQQVLQSQLSARQINRAEYDRSLRGLREEKTDINILARLLREIADNTKNAAKSQAEELVRRLRINDRSTASAWLDRLSEDSGDLATNSRRQAAAAIIRERWGLEGGGGFLGGLMPGAERGAGGGWGGQLVGGLVSYAAGRIPMMGRLLSASMAFAPAAILGGAAYAGVSRYSNLFEAARAGAVYGGSDVNLNKYLVDSFDNNTNLVRLGLKPADYFALNATYTQAGGRPLSMDNLATYFSQQRAYNMSQGEVSGVLSVNRFAQGSSTANNQAAIATLANISQGAFGNYTRISDLVSSYQAAAQQALSVGGSFNQQALLGTINSLSRGGIQGPQLDRIMGSFANMGNSMNPFMQTIMRKNVIDMLGPEATAWDVETVLENPLEHPELINKVLSDIEKLTGSEFDQAKREIANGFGLSHRDVNALFAARDKGGDTFNNFLKELQIGENATRIQERAENLTSVGEYVGASWDDFKNQVVMEAKKVLDINNEQTKTALDKIDKSVSDLNQTLGNKETGVFGTIISILATIRDSLSAMSSMPYNQASIYG